MKRVERLKHENEYIIKCKIDILFNNGRKSKSTIDFERLCDMYYYLYELSKIPNIEFTYTYEYINNERILKNEKI